MAVETPDSSETVRPSVEHQECAPRDSVRVVSPDSSCAGHMSPPPVSEPGPSTRESSVIRLAAKPEPGAYRTDPKRPVLPQLLAGSPIVSSSTSPVPPRSLLTAVVMGPPPPPPPAQPQLGPKPAKASRPRKSAPAARRSHAAERHEEPSSSIPEIGECPNLTYTFNRPERDYESRVESCRVVSSRVPLRTGLGNATRLRPRRSPSLDAGGGAA